MVIKVIYNMRTYSNIIGSVLLLTSMFSCNDPMEVDNAELDVWANEVVVPAGKSVVFNVSGNVKSISFYSGESGNDYRYKDVGRQLPIESLELNFGSLLSNAKQKSERYVLLSTDFNGNYKDIGVIQKATWQDVTSHFTLAGSNNETESGTLNLDEFIIPGKPLYIAFRYLCFPITSESGAPSWRINRLLLNAKTEEGDMKVADISTTAFTAGFNIVDFGKGTNMESISIVSASLVRLQGKDGPTEQGNEVWAISKGIDTGVLSLLPDAAVPVKGVADADIRQYVHTYMAPGRYTAVFVGSNITAGHRSEVVKSIEIEVLP